MLRRYTNVIERAQAAYGPVDALPWSYVSELDAFTIYHKIQEKNRPVPTSSLLDALGHAVAGAAGTAVSNVLVYPLDLVVTRLQVQSLDSRSIGQVEDDTQYQGLRDAIHKIYHDEGGVPAFYSGVTHDTLKSAADSFLFFLIYNSLWRAGHNRTIRNDTGLLLRWLDDVGIGMIAGAATRGITAPMQQVITRKQTLALASAKRAEDKKSLEFGREQSVSEILQHIYRINGLQGFWSGYSATVILTLNPSLTMSVDSMLRRILSGSAGPGPTLTFLLAAVSKAIASSLMYPVALAKTRAQATAVTAHGNSRQRKTRPGTFLTTITDIARHDGAGALYAGLSGEVVKGFFSHGLTMLVKQRIHRFVIRFYCLLVRLLKRNGARG